MSVALAPLPTRPVTVRHDPRRPRSGPGAHTVVRVPRPIAAAAPSRAVYRRRRAVVAVFVAALVAVIGVAVGGGEASRTSSPGPGMRSYLVQPGDTLWAIAAHHAGATPMVDYVETLVELNGGALIRAGEWIVLP